MTTTTAAFTDARRELRSLTAGFEKRILLWLAARMPDWVGSDHLTALGLAAMVVAAYLVYDLVGVAMAAALAVVLIASSARTTRQLYALEWI